MANLLELARKLHRERLFIRSEREAIHQLNKQIRLRSEKLSHVFWTTRQHHLNLNHFVTNSSQGVPATCSLRASHLDNVKFVDAYKELGYQETMYASFLHAFRSNPTLAAACLAYGEKLGLGSTIQVVQFVVLGIYGNSIISGDHRHLLELMETLLLLQLANEDQPRRVMHKGNVAFCVVYKLFTESSLAGRLFLTSALHRPVMQVLMADELYLECDSRKMLDCFSQVDIEKKFGKQDDPEFQDRIKRHIKLTEDKFFEVCQSFIDSLHAAMFCFPQSIGWVVARAYHIVKEAGLVTSAEARALCSDLMLQMFISPAIVTPELYGVTGDAPISEFTRFNLMQIAQTLQILTHRDEDAQPDNTFYSRFKKNCMNSLLDAVIDTWHTDGVPTTATSEHEFKECSVFLTCSQLAQLIELLREIQHSDVRGVDQSSLAEVLSHLPVNPPPAIAQVAARRESASSSLQSDTIASEDAETRRNSSVGSSGSTGHPSPMPHWANESPVLSSGAAAKKLFSKSGKYSAVDETKPQTTNDGPDVVLVLSLAGVSGTSADPPGMLSENEVLEMHACNGSIAELNSERGMAGAGVNVLNDADSERMDKRLRFSHCSTDFSELEGGTEAISSSTSGSLMDDIDPVESVPADDTSSFRGTSSHGNQDEDLEMEEGDLESVPHTNNDEALKALERKLPTSRESIEDKMRKFEIRSQLGVRFGGAVVAGPGSDEADRAEAGHGTINYLDTRSETWSTDVYASDSETPTEQGDPPEQPDRLQEIAENPGRGQMRNSASGPYLALLPRDEDARSDVWSVEVLPSDSEPPDVKPEDRLQELESESNAGQEDSIDPMDDVRSRASTPSLSAASGVSGTSGMSLVSDNLHAKGGEEHGSSSERSFRKTPSSISPDADDMIVSNRGQGAGPHSSRLSGAGSSHSSGSGDGATSNARQHFAAASVIAGTLLLDGQTRSIGAGGSDHDLHKKTSKRGNIASLAVAGRIGSERKPTSPVTMPSGANHLNWPEKTGADGRRDTMNGCPDPVLGDTSSALMNLKPEAASTPDHEVTSDSNDTNTIKRSPYKHNDAFTTDKASSAFDSVPVSAARDVSTGAAGVAASLTSVRSDFARPATTGPLIGYVKMNGNLPGSFQESPSVTKSTFVPITTAGLYALSPPPPHDISSFDPLSSTAVPLELQARPKRVPIGNNLLNMNSMSAAMADLSTGSDSPQANRGIDQQSQIPSPVPATHGGKQSKHGLPKRSGVDHDVRGVERKKSWWKNARLPVLSSKRKTFRMSASLQNSKEEQTNGNGDVADTYLKPAGDDGHGLPKPLEPTSASSFQSDTLGEDIMEKYMRKAASNQSSPKTTHNREAPVPSAAAVDNVASSGVIRDCGKSFLEVSIPEDKMMETQNPNSSSSNTDPQSTPSNISSSASEQTVTLVAPEPWSNMSPPSVPDRLARAVPSSCLAAVPKEAEYMPDSAQSIADAQRKLRLMLATSESFPESSLYSGILPRMVAQSFTFSPQQRERGEGGGASGSRSSTKEEIILFLKLQLAEAVSLQDHSRIAQIHETTRCVQVLDGRGCKEVLQNLWREYKQRSSYVAYLVRTKEALLTVSSYLQHVFRCTQRDQETCRRYFTTVFVNLFLKRMETPLRSFRTQFTQATAADEKVALVHRFLSFLYGQMSKDGIWESTSEEQLHEAERAVERSVFVYIYKLAIYPNGDGDVMRDQLLHQHIARLSEVVTSQHPALLIPRKYLNECPWTSAQAEAKSLNAYKTPRDKLAAVLRCCSTIMNLLKMADEGTVPGADDFLPVLVYVLIKANPAHLLSTVQYITSFLGDHLTGEDSYWWMQFTAATEFIKTIDERK